jgi:hypothetical protein
MPSIPLDVLDTTIYLYKSPEAAERGEQAGGSGFLVMVPLEEYPAGTFYAVTNTHVVAAGFTTARLNTADGGHRAIEFSDEDWFRHPDGDDISIAEITLSSEFRFRAVSTESFIDGFDPTLFHVGQEVFMVGRFVNHEGRQSNRPTARFGHIAQLPYERIRTTRGIEQDGFLVDMRSLAGYSGSPVFVYRNRPDLTSDDAEWVMGIELRFLGVDFGHLPLYARVLRENRDRAFEPPMWVEQNSGVAAVIPAWRLKQLIDDEEVARIREESERAWISEYGNTQPSSG